jgi:urease accessory protein
MNPSLARTTKQEVYMRQMASHAFVGGLLSLLLIEPSYAHGFVGSGWLHPLTGLDHMLAMIAVGAWSAQLGGRAIYRVPLAFLAAMVLGAALGIGQYPLRGTELAIPLSVLILGVAIALERKVTPWIAALGVGLFGICHGYAHGYEMPAAENPWGYAAGFLLTTAGLHLIGAIGGQLLLESRRGQRRLVLAGLVVAFIGGYLVVA